MDKYIGKVLDNRYELLEVIGVGGTAVVYKAKCHRLNRYVAIKILKDEFSSDEEFRRQFHDESQAVAVLSHPNIVNVYDVSRSGNIEYIVMELIDGITLKDYLSRRGQLTPKEVTIFATQIAKALEHAHSRNIIHRDIKPQNIMLLRDGTVKVADFGIAHFTTQENTYSKGEAIGSVHYVSPEQARGSHVDNRTDLYSLGVVMYEMIAGRLPFEGDTPVSIALQHINSVALPPSVFAEDVPPRLEEITMKAMNPTLSKRYVSATQILEDLESFQNDQQFKLNIPREEGDNAAMTDEGLDATRKLNNTGEMALMREMDSHALSDDTDDEEDDLPQHSGKKKSTMSASLIFSIVAVAVFFFGAIYFLISVIDPFGGDKTQKISAPNLVGKLYQDVMADDAYSGFHIVEGEYVYDETAPEGQIIKQSPEADRKMDPDGTITVTISRGVKSVTLNNYVNMDVRQVKIELDRLGIAYMEGTAEYHDTIEKGYVIRTEPEVGTEMNPGDTVTLIVSLGAETKTTEMPDLMGHTEEEANQLLAAKHLIGQPAYVESDEAAGIVIFQSVPFGTAVEEGTTINFNVSKAKEPAAPVSVAYTFSLIASDQPISVDVRVDGASEYTGMHATDEGTVSVTLTATPGEHKVEVYQNGAMISQETVKF